MHMITDGKIKTVSRNLNYPITCTLYIRFSYNSITVNRDIFANKVFPLVKFSQSRIFVAYTNVRNTSLYQLICTKYFTRIIFVRKDYRQKILTVKISRSMVLWIIIVLIILDSPSEVDWAFFLGLGFIFLLSLFKQEFFAFFHFHAPLSAFFSLHKLVCAYLSDVLLPSFSVHIPPLFSYSLS